MHELATALPSAVQPEAAPPTRGESYSFTFTGSGSEYFGVWLVNLTLSVLTLGVYSAWAKVRRLQYFHRHTRVAGASFDYHGEPFAILKGRIVAVCLLAVYTFAELAGPVGAAAAFVLIGLVLPWLLMRSMIFRLRMTSYRGLRFAFRGSLGQAYWVFLGLPLLSVPALFLLVPFCHHRIKRYQVANAAWGTAPFHVRADAPAFYRMYGAGIGLLVLWLAGAVFTVLITLAVLPSGMDARTRDLVKAFVSVALYAAMFLGVRAFFDARVRALVWGDTWLGPHRIMCFIEPGRLFLLSATNLLAILLTLGLYVPFAQVRVARYLASVVYLVPRGTVDDVAAVDEEEVGAVGQESASFLDLDIAI